MNKKINDMRIEDLLKESRKLRMIYITCARIAVNLYGKKSDNFIERKAKEFYELATCRIPYVEKQIVLNKWKTS